MSDPVTAAFAFATAKAAALATAIVKRDAAQLGVDELEKKLEDGENKKLQSELTRARAALTQARIDEQEAKTADLDAREALKRVQRQDESAQQVASAGAAGADQFSQPGTGASGSCPLFSLPRCDRCPV
jgi:hypothetical protein